MNAVKQDISPHGWLTFGRRFLGLFSLLAGIVAIDIYMRTNSGIGIGDVILILGENLLTKPLETLGAIGTDLLPKFSPISYLLWFTLFLSAFNKFLMFARIKWSKISYISVIAWIITIGLVTTYGDAEIARGASIADMSQAEYLNQISGPGSNIFLIQWFVAFLWPVVDFLDAMFSYLPTLGRGEESR